MSLYSSESLPAISNVPFNSKNTKASIVKPSQVNNRPVQHDELTQTVESSSAKPNSPQLHPQPKPSSCKQCQFCSHFQLELAHWGRCSALSALVPGQATACILHEPYFRERKTVVPLAQLQRSTVKEDSLNVLRTNAYYQYPSTGC